MICVDILHARLNPLEALREVQVLRCFAEAQQLRGPVEPLPTADEQAAAMHTVPFDGPRWNAANKRRYKACSEEVVCAS